VERAAADGEAKEIGSGAGGGHAKAAETITEIA